MILVMLYYYTLLKHLVVHLIREISYDISYVIILHFIKTPCCSHSDMESCDNSTLNRQHYAMMIVSQAVECVIRGMWGQSQIQSQTSQRVFVAPPSLDEAHRLISKH